MNLRLGQKWVNRDYINRVQGAKLVIVFGSVRQRVAYFLWIFLLAALADDGFCVGLSRVWICFEQAAHCIRLKCWAGSTLDVVTYGTVQAVQDWLWRNCSYRFAVQSVQEEVDLYALFPPIKDVVYLVVVWLCVG